MFQTDANVANMTKRELLDYLSSHSVVADPGTPKSTLRAIGRVLNGGTGCVKGRKTVTMSDDKRDLLWTLTNTASTSASRATSEREVTDAIAVLLAVYTTTDARAHASVLMVWRMLDRGLITWQTAGRALKEY